MKFKYLLLLLFSSSVFAQDFHTYELFNNNFKAAFPGQPLKHKVSDSTQQLIKHKVPDATQQLKKTQSYVYIDDATKIVFTAHYMPTNMKQENYTSPSIKIQLDDHIKKELTITNQKIINFSSTTDNKSTYIAIWTSKYIEEGIKMYTSTKRIYYKDKLYIWNVMSDDNSSKHVFDKYRKYSAIIK